MGETNNSQNQSKPVSFFEGVKAEFKKVIWPDKMEIVKQTITVSVVSIVLGLLIALIDTIVQYGVNFLTMQSEGKRMAEANWYVVHTYSGYENKVKANIEKTIGQDTSLSRKRLRIRVPQTVLNYLTVCTRTGGLDFYDYCETDNWLVSIKTGNLIKCSTNVFNHLYLDSLFASVAQLVVAPHL